MKSSDNQYDVVVNGAGMTGSSFSAALGQTGIKILILDRRPIIFQEELEPRRVSAINKASENLLKNVNVWDELISHNSTHDFEKIKVWDELGNGMISFEASSLGLENLGHIVPNSDICQTLHHALKFMPGASLQFESEIISIDKMENGVFITLNSGEKIFTKLLVGADGVNSAVRKLEGILQSIDNYNHTAIVATVDIEPNYNKCAYQCFTKIGPLAFLPISKDKCSIVWSVLSSNAARLLEMNENNFLDELDYYFNSKFGRLKKISDRISFPLSRRHAKTYIADHTALIGDAAHTIHPLAGLGANQGLADGAALSQVITESLKKNRNFSSRLVLRKYERWRQYENELALKIIDGFHSVFDANSSAILKARNIGLYSANRSTFLKKIFMNYATGLSGHLPELCQTAPKK